MKTSICSLIFLFALSGNALATCSATNGQGTWQAYINSVSSTGGFYWLRCPLVFNSSGVINPATSSCTDPHGRILRVSGRIFLASSCEITGYITTGSVTNTLTQAWMSTGHDVVSGVGSWNSGLFQFTAIKR